MKKKNLLWISLCAPYLSVTHAGGQSLCHFYEEFLKSSNFAIKLICFYSEDEKKAIRDSLVGSFDNVTLLLDPVDRFSKFIDIENRANPWNRYGGYLSNSREKVLRESLIQYKAENVSPDYIILQWTEIVVYISHIKKMFPSSKIVVIEEDVSFLKRERRYNRANNELLKLFHKVRYLHSKRCELEALEKADIVVVNNRKDENLVVSNGISSDKIFCCCPYFKPMFSVEHRQKNRDILFWGAMGRRENSESVMWFIENVMPTLSREDYRFVVIGSNPPKELKNKENTSVRIIGYVDNPSSYFQDCFCLVAPLIMGAGIKVKILEALSAGIPIITNGIGIEGIPATNGINYFHAENANEYVEAIHTLASMDEDTIKNFSDSEKKLVQSEFNFISKITDLILLIMKS